jgi:prepilin-type N-terminal cleavage/methylation domain-containing protein
VRKAQTTTSPTMAHGTSRRTAFTLVELPFGKLRTVRQTQRRAFTLVELLVVIAIIMLLAGILVPTVASVLKTSEAARAKVRLTELADGCESFKLDNEYYPGQANRATWAPRDGGSYTGSQILAACLFSYVVADIPASPPEFSSKYASCKEGDLMDYASQPNCVGDPFAKNRRPVLYYPSKVGFSGLEQYDFMDNVSLVAFSGGGVLTEETTGFAEYIRDERFSATSATPYNDKRFLLIVAGTGADGMRAYGLDSDLRNWNE